MKARVYVTLAAGVLDARGQAVQKTLARLGFDEVGGVRVGTYIELELARPAGRAGKDMDVGMDVDEMRARVQAMCEQLLANPVIEEYRVELEEESEGERQGEPETEIDA